MCFFLTGLIVGLVSVLSSLIVQFHAFLFLFATAIPSRKKKVMGVPEVGVSEEGVCCKIVFL